MGQTQKLVTAMDLRLLVTVDLTDRVYNLLAGWQAVQVSPEVEMPRAETATAKAAPTISATPTISRPPTPAAKPYPRELTVADVREAMHFARSRVLGVLVNGENARDIMARDCHKALWAELDACFIRKARDLGADAPTRFDTTEQRFMFIKYCGRLVKSEDGHVTESAEAPPF